MAQKEKKRKRRFFRNSFHAKNGENLGGKWLNAARSSDTRASICLHDGCSTGEDTRKRRPLGARVSDSATRKKAGQANDLPSSFFIARTYVRVTVLSFFDTPVTSNRGGQRRDEKKEREREREGDGRKRGKRREEKKIGWR